MNQSSLQVTRKLSVKQPPRWLIVWALLTLASSIVWPRYDYRHVISVLPNLSPFTAMAFLSWPLTASSLLFLPSLRRAVLQLVNHIWPILGIFVLWFGWRLIADTLGETPKTSLLFTLNELLCLGAFIPLGSLLALTTVTQRWTVRVLILCTAIVIAAALVEQMTGSRITDLLGLQLNPMDPVSLEVVTEKFYRGGVWRLASVFIHANTFGQFLALSAPFAIYLLQTDRRRGFRVIALLVLAAIPWTILQTVSRSSLIALGVSITAYVSISAVSGSRPATAHTWIRFVAVAIFVLLCGLAFQSTLMDLVGGRTASEMGSSMARQDMLYRGLQAVADSPLSGFGDGRSKFHAGIYGFHHMISIDTYYLSTLLDFGWVGLILMLLAWGSVLLMAIRLAFNSKDQRLAAAYAASLVSLFVGLSVVSISDNLQMLYLSIMFLPGLIKTREGRQFDTRHSHTSRTIQSRPAYAR